ncbi:MAG: two-component sensor histidine kinase, partial [Clostridiales bacterium]|nr:two-component sensor histidine kinase [Clostridiales bacterium]
MIRKLRIRLILISMMAVLLVMIILIGGINISNYRQVVSESDDILELLMNNGGAFAAFSPNRDPKDWIDPRTGEPLPEFP